MWPKSSRCSLQEVPNKPMKPTPESFALYLGYGGGAAYRQR